MYVIVDSELAHSTWLLTSLTASDVKPLVAEHVAVEKYLENIPEQQALLVVLEMPCNHGLRATSYIAQRVNTIRAACPSVGIVFVSEAEALLRDEILPHLVWAVSAEDGDIAAIMESVQIFKLECCPRYRHTMVDAAFHVPPKRHNQSTQKTGYSNTHVLPNYNIKHPAMLVPLALLSRQLGQDIFCEISPQEALTFYRAGSLKNSRALVENAFRHLKRDIDRVNKAFNARLRLHLDHCDDLYLINAAADCGFDSIMADGSGMTHGQNIRFTCAAKKIITPYGIPLEGEVGSIDGSGLRKWNKTQVDDFICFVEKTGVDFVGANVGQFHSYSYDFAHARRQYAHIYMGTQKAGADDLGCFVNACQSLDLVLETQGYSRTSSERLAIARAVSQATNKYGNPRVFDILEEMREKLSFYQLPIADQLENHWLANRFEYSTQKLERWNATFAPPHRKEPHRYANVDFSLVSELSSLLDPLPTWLVVHGGSSLSRPDLIGLSKHKIARINFGSEVFKSFVDALHTEIASDSTAPEEMNHFQKMHFLHDAAGDWKNWLEELPAFIHAFAERIRRQHVDVLARPQVLHSQKLEFSKAVAHAS